MSGINQHGGGEEGLVGRIGKVNEIAERIGGKVRGLDEELLRVREAGERLNEVMELKVSLYRKEEERREAMKLTASLCFFRNASLNGTDFSGNSERRDQVQGLGDSCSSL